MLFFEAFENLNVSKEVHDLFQSVDVEKIVASKAKKQLCIHIRSNRLITYTNIKKMEYQLKKQIFTGVMDNIMFEEHYNLSEQYTAEKLMPIYYDSFLLELKEKYNLNINLSTITFYIITL